MTVKALDEYRWVFIGTGGTFYMAAPYLATMLRRFGHYGRPLLFDPDTVNPAGSDRQWPGMEPGTLKVRHAESMLGMACIDVDSEFHEHDQILVEKTANRPVLAIVNVDNNAARLAVREWLGERQSDGAMLVSGCERHHGQCYYGVWRDGEAWHDWLTDHQDVAETVPSEAHMCNIQSPESNLLTATLVGMNLDDLIEDLILREAECSPIEWYWNQDEEGKLLVWHSMVTPTSQREGGTSANRS